MPFSSIDGAKEGKFPTSAEGVDLTLPQINKLAEIYDAVKAEGETDNPMAVAWTQWKKLFEKSGDSWVQIKKNSKDNPEMFDIKDVEIFDFSGKPNGHDYRKYVEGMLKGFYETKDALKPYLKLGHDDKQKLAQNSGMPALGWVENLKIKGKKFLADFSKVPKVVYELMRRGAYRRISPEIFWNITINGKKYDRLFKAVSLLGADTPACENLEDIMKLYNQDDGLIKLYQESSKLQSNSYEFDVVNNSIKEEVIENMDRVKELEAQVKKYEEQKAEAEQKVADAEKKVKDAEKKAEEAEKAKTDAEAKVAEAEKKEEEAKKEEVKTEVNSRIDKLIEEKHLLPADKDALATVIFNSETEAEVKSYKIGEEEKSLKDILFSVLEKYTVDMNTEEDSETGKTGKKGDKSELVTKAEKYQKEHEGVSFKDALIAVSE